MSARLTGVSASPGLAVGPVARLASPPVLPDTAPAVEDVAAEQARATQALESVAADLKARAEAVGGEAADVLTATAMMAEDPALADSVADLVAGGTAAAWAVTEAFGQYRDMLESAGGYLAERVADLDDVRSRAVAVLLGQAMPGVPVLDHPYVLVAEDLAPADTATLTADRVLALITMRGGPTSHTAILAKSLGIPAVVGLPAAADLVDEQVVAVDGSAGLVTVDPDEAQVADVRKRAEDRAARLAASHGPGRTADGQKVTLLLNAGGASDANRVTDTEAEGIGLLRTEFLFMERRTAPTVDEQRESYEKVFSAVGDGRVVVRTLDAGADKPLPFADLGEEPNPALGVRGLRTAWKYPQLLEDQLEAIAAAAANWPADVWVMAPMIATADETRDFVAKVHSYGLDKAGVMIEVPSAALCAEAIVAEADFVSIGTNDLSQYTFAADRMAGELAGLLDPFQPALLRLVQLTAQAGKAAGKPVGVCGDAASDPLLACVLTGLGITSLSMPAGSVADVRLALAERTLQEMQDGAARAAAARNAVEARAAAAQ